MRTITLLISLLAVTPAWARPGFSVGLGLGGSGVGGETVDTGRLSSDTAGIEAGFPLTTNIDGGLAALFTMGFNVLGYGAIETRLAGQGTDLSDGYHRKWAAHWHTGVRAYPLWHWQAQLPEYLHPLEPSLFVGWGTTYQGYVPTPDNEVAWSTWSSWRFGLAVEYFIITYFKVSLDYSYVLAPYSKFIYDWDESITFNVEPTANTGFHQFFVVASFQFAAEQAAVRY
jgi:hypothetical protein